MASPDRRGLSRRDVLKTAGADGAALGAASLMPGGWLLSKTKGQAATMGQPGLNILFIMVDQMSTPATRTLRAKWGKLVRYADWKDGTMKIDRSLPICAQHRSRQ